MKSRLETFWKDERGLGTLEILLIVAVLIAIAIAFRKYIISWVNELFSQADDSFKEMNNESEIQTPGD